MEIKKEDVKKNRRIFVGIILIIIVGFFAFNFYKNYQAKTEYQETKVKLNDFVKKHNQKVKTLKPEEKVMTSKEETLKPEKVIVKEVEDRDEDKDEDKRKIVPYLEPLPEMPDFEENNSTLLGIDSNNNGVRDDVEIEIVEEFGDDRDVVEAFFASARHQQLNLKNYRDGKYDDEEFVKEFANNSGKFTRCERFYYEQSEFEEEEEYYTKSHEMDKLSINNKERNDVLEKTSIIFSGHIFPGYDGSDELCQQVFQESKSWDLR